MNIMATRTNALKLRMVQRKRAAATAAQMDDIRADDEQLKRERVVERFSTLAQRMGSTHILHSSKPPAKWGWRAEG